ncbi:MAG TPA: glycosyl hydrolase family 28-related protein [Sphingomicrobium sp.]
MADFQPRFVDLVRNFTTTVGTGDFVLGAAVNGYTGFDKALQPGDSFYYSAIGVDKPQEREVGRGTLQANGAISREPVDGAPTNFTTGTKTLSLIAAAEWFNNIQATAGASTAAASTRPMLAQFTSTQVPVMLTERGREGLFVFDPSNLAAAIAADPRQGLFVAPASDPTGASGAWARKLPGSIDVRWFGAIGDGVTDDTAAIAAALSAGSMAHIPAGAYVVSSLSIPANTAVTTDGHDTILIQKPGTGATTPIIKIKSSNVRVGDISVQGRLGLTGDTTGEWNHGVQIGLEPDATNSISNVTVGNVRGTNIRGDVVSVVVHSTAYGNGHRLSEISVGKISGTNVYRHVCAITGGSAISIESITGSQVGYMMFDIETDPGSGTVCGVTVGYIKGHHAAAVGTTGADCLEGIQIGEVDLDPAHCGPSSPLYAPIPAQVAGFLVRNTKNLEIGAFKANGHAQSALASIIGDLAHMAVHIGSAEVPTSNTSNSVYGHFHGGPGLELHIDHLVAATTTSNQRVFEALDCLAVGRASVDLAGGRFLSDCSNSVVELADVTSDGTANGTVLMMGCHNCHIRGGAQVVDQGIAFGGGSNSVGNSALTTTTAVINSSSGSYLSESFVNGTYYTRFNGGYAGISIGTDNIVANVTGYIQANNGAYFDLWNGSTYKCRGVTAIDENRNASFADLTVNGVAFGPAGLALMDDADAAAQRATLGLAAIAASGSGTDLTASSIGYSKIQNVGASSKLLGRASAGAGSIEELGLAGGLTISGTNLALGAITPASVATTGAVTSSGGGMGYATGAGGTITQNTNKSTGVTLNKLCGQITMAASALAANTTASFTLTNSNLAAGDLLILNHVSGGTAGAYALNAQCSAGSASISVRNVTAGSLSEAIVIGFAIQKAVTA